MVNNTIFYLLFSIILSNYYNNSVIANKLESLEKMYVYGALHGISHKKYNTTYWFI